MELQGPCLGQGVEGPLQSPRRLARRLRNLRKKLREIANLERHEAYYQALPCEVLQKLARRSSVEADIATLVAALVEAHEAISVRSEHGVALAFTPHDEKHAVQQALAGPSVWDKATATPATATPAGSNRSNSHSDWDKAEVGNSIEAVGDQSCEKDRDQPFTSSRDQGQAFGEVISSAHLDSAVLETVEAQRSCPVLVSVQVKVGKESVDFRVPGNLQLMKSLGSGSYGAVAAFWDVNSNQRVAVKKVPDALSDLSSGMRALREIRVLSSTNHDNIVKMRYFYCDECSSRCDVYIIQECVDIDLHSVIRKSGHDLTEKHHKYILYGTLRGLTYLHNMDVAHRDLKPANILVNSDCSVKICDFNLSRGGMEAHFGRSTRLAQAEHAELSGYVCTRWYRAPEVMLFKGRYGKPADLWSLGCIVCELLSSKAIFKGKNSNDQIRQIVNVIGSPPKEDLEGRSFHTGIPKLLRSLSTVHAKSWLTVLPGASGESINVIDRLLKFSPEKRITAKECLRQPYFSRLYRTWHEGGPPLEMDWSFDEPVSTPARLRELLCGEGCAFVGKLDSPESLLKSLPPGASWADFVDDE